MTEHTHTHTHTQILYIFIYIYVRYIYNIVYVILKLKIYFTVNTTSLRMPIFNTKNNVTPMNAPFNA